MSSVCGEAGRIYLERFCDSCSSFSVVDADEARGVEQEKHEDVPVCTQKIRDTACIRAPNDPSLGAKSLAHNAHIIESER